MVWTIPNVLSLLRLIAAPVLLVLAYQGRAQVFLGLYGAALVTDIIDGKLARWLNQTSEFGAKLDSWGDFALYMTVPLDAYWLRPDFVHSEWPTFFAIVAAYTCPVAIGFFKYRRLTSYHTKGAVLSAYLVGAASFVVFAQGPAWPLRLATLVLLIAELEEIAITAVLPQWTANVSTLGRALKIRAQLEHTSLEAPR